MAKWMSIFHIFLIVTLVLQVESYSWAEWGEGKNWGKRSNIVSKIYKRYKWPSLKTAERNNGVKQTDPFNLYKMEDV